MQKVLEGILNFFEDVQKFVSKIWDFLAGIGDFIKRLINWVVDFVKEVPIMIFDKFMTALSDFINSFISLIPDSILTEVANFSTIFNSSVMNFWIAPFRPGYGITLIISAYALRFLIRRIPFIG